MTVGRQAEREALASFVDDLVAGPSALLLEGEPGIGKSTLWNDCVELAGTRGCLVLSCRPTGSDTELSFVGLGDLFREVPPDRFTDLPEPQREALEISLLRRSRGPRRPDPRAISVAALRLLQELATNATLLVAVDDVQWLDPASARVLGFVIRRVTGGVGFLLARSEMGDPWPLGVADSLPTHRLGRVLLEPVGAADLAELVRQRIGAAMSISEAKRLAEVSGGNPFFALEIARAVMEGDQGVTGQSLPIPRSLREDIVNRRLGTLPPASADLLLVAAAAGRSSLDLLRATAGGRRIDRILQHPIDAGIIQVLGADVRFTHPIYRSAIYAHASRSRRHVVHRRLAELASDPEERARHLALSADSSDDEIAVTLEEAADLARDRGAPDAAAELLEHSIRLTPPTSIAEIRRRHIEATDHRFVAGDLERASDHANNALRLSESGVERAEARLGVAAIDLERGAISQARRALEAASEEAEGDARVSAMVLRELAEVSLRSGDLALADHHARSARKRSGASGEAALVMKAETTWSRIGLLRGEAAQVLASASHRMRTRPTSETDPRELLLAEAEMVTAEHERARRRLEVYLAAATERGDEPGRRAALVRLAELELRDGSWDRADSRLDGARTLAHHLGLGNGLEVGLRAYIAALRGRAEEAKEAAADGLRGAGDDWQAQLWNLGALGVLELSLGRTDVALRHLGRAGGIVTEMGLGEPATFPFLSDEAEALIASGELTAADRRISWLQERGEALGRGSALAAAARCGGLLLAERGDLSGALVSAELAVERYSALPLPFERGRSLLTLGTLRRRDRQKRAAREALEGALEILETLGASIWAERSREELMRISGRRASLTELTESELRVVRLAASGLTNREIARALSMSVRTVEGHLSHTYAKLGLRSRTELAVFFERSD